MTNPLRISKGEVIAGKFVSGDGYKFGDGTLQPTAAGETIVRYSPTFSATGLTFTGSNSTYPTYNSYYVKIGHTVTFMIKVNLSTVTNFGTGQFKLELPFTPYDSIANHFTGWVWVDPSQPADALNGHIQVSADHLYGDPVLDLHWYQATTAEPKPVIEKRLIQGDPVTLTTTSIIEVSGTYICA